MPGLAYSVIGILAIIIHCIVNSDILFFSSYRKANKTSEIDKTTIHFHNFLWGILLYYITDAMWGILDEAHQITMLGIDTFVYYLAMSLAVVLWTDYVVSYLEQKNILGKLLRIAAFTFLAFEVIALLVNIVYPFFFWFDDEGIYHAGPIRYITLYIQIALFLGSTVQTLIVAMRSEGVKRRRHIAISIFGLSMSAAIVAQIEYPLLPIYSIGYLVGTCFLHRYVSEDEKEENYQKIKREMDIVSSMASMYFCSYYVDMKNMTYVEIKNNIAENMEFIGKQGNAYEAIEKMCKHLILPEYRTEAEKFLNLDTLNQRLGEKQFYVSMQMETIHIGWAEGVFVVCDRADDGSLNHVIWALRTINDEKNKEEKLMYNSYIDELTGLYNRKMFAEDIDGSMVKLADGVNPVDIGRDDFVFISLDVNGLKTINDTKGHAAGDELLQAASKCMKRCFGPYGRVYRTGGDEYIALLNVSAEQLEEALMNFESTTAGYRGKFVESVSVSYGYVARRDHMDLSIMEIETLADKNMYMAKNLHYTKNGVNRRGQQDAYKALCALYNKILMVNFTDNTYSIISMDESEQTAEKGFTDGIFEWLENFALSGQVHEDDRAEYLDKTNRAYLIDYFKGEKTSLSFTYRRNTGGEFKMAEMEMIPTENYTDDKQILFLYVKNIDK